MTDAGWQRLRSVCCALVLIGGFAAAAAQYVSPMALVGRWSFSSRSAEGNAAETQVVFTQNKYFQGFSTSDGQTVVEFRGSWSVEDSMLTWRYESSTGPAPAAGGVETDEIVSVEAAKLVLRSRSGTVREFVRAR